MPPDPPSEKEIDQATIEHEKLVLLDRIRLLENLDKLQDAQIGLLKAVIGLSAGFIRDMITNPSDKSEVLNVLNILDRLSKK